MIGARLILASNSPRRAELLREAGFLHFEILPAHVDESHDPNLSPEELTIHNARHKALHVAPIHPSALVIAADTLVYLDGLPYGKPADLEEAASMLRRLSNRTHSVCTGVALAHHASNWIDTFAVTTWVTFRALEESDIAAYHRRCDPLDKAGGYGIQDAPEIIVSAIEGSWSNVVGLPIEVLSAKLRALTPEKGLADRG